MSKGGIQCSSLLGRLRPPDSTSPGWFRLLVALQLSRERRSGCLGKLPAGIQLQLPAVKQGSQVGMSLLAPAALLWIL